MAYELRDETEAIFEVVDLDELDGWVEEVVPATPHWAARAAGRTRDKSGYLHAKRIIDIVLSAFLLILLSPMLLLVAWLVKVDSPGPAIFAQERMGYDRQKHRPRRFIFYKFRSMYHQCDQSIHQQRIREWIRGRERAKGDADVIKVKNDPRITRVGRALRKTSMDELPQLWNVLKGDMSLVGPRPVPLYEVSEYDEWHKQRLLAPPGITGLWQVQGRGQVTVDEMAQLDLEYIENRCLRLDFEILLRTVPAVISGRGAV